MILVKKIIKIKYLLSLILILGIGFYFVQKTFVQKTNIQKPNVQKTFVQKTIAAATSVKTNARKRTVSSKAILFNRGTSYKWNKPVKLEIQVIDRIVKEAGLELLLKGVFYSELDLQQAVLTWSLGKYTQLVEGQSSLEYVDIKKNQIYSYQIRVLDVSKSNQKVYLSVNSQNPNLHHSISIDTNQSLKIIEKQKLQKKQKLQEKLTVNKKKLFLKKNNKQPMY